MKTTTTLLLALLSIIPLLAKEQPVAIMPSVSGKDLNGRPWTAPGGLPGGRTLILIGFDEPQQVAIDTWTQGLGLDQPTNKIPWIEMPLINNPGMFMRWFIDTGMRGGIRDRNQRSHVWTAYTNRKAFMESCGIASDQEVCVLVVDRSGRILQKEAGTYSRAGAQRLIDSLRN